jgi:hypothetical protein
VRSGPGKTTKNKKRKKKYSGQQQKEIDCDEPHPAPNEKTQPIQWTERPTGALVAVNSLWPWRWSSAPILPLEKERSTQHWYELGVLVTLSWMRLISLGAGGEGAGLGFMTQLMMNHN